MTNQCHHLVQTPGDNLSRCKHHINAYFSPSHTISVTVATIHCFEEGTNRFRKPITISALPHPMRPNLYGRGYG